MGLKRLEIVYTSPNQAFVKGSFSLEAIDLLGCGCFEFAVGVKNVDDITADDRDRVFLATVGIFDRKVKVLHRRSPLLY